MFIEWLIKKFVKNSEDIKNHEVRSLYTYFAGIIGMLINFVLFLIKLSIGTFVGSIAIVADGFNNLSDTASSAITMIGIKLANAPADKNHPYGHGRIEYISALAVSALVMLVGFQLAWSSIGRVLNPVPITFSWLSFSLLLISIFFKLWLSLFNKKVGERINSSALKAAGVDAFGDVLVSSTVLVSFVIAPFMPFAIDGFIGIGVAIFILYMSFNLIGETVSPLLGEAPDTDLVEAIHEKIKTYPHILGVHDLVIHNYGVGRIMATIHVEFLATLDIMEIHEIIDQAERELSDELNIQLVIHMDPVSVETDEIKVIKQTLKQIFEENSIIISMHDFRVNHQGENKKISFDLLIDGNQLTKENTAESIKEEVTNKVYQKYPDYECMIIVDKCFGKKQ